MINIKKQDCICIHLEFKGVPKYNQDFKNLGKFDGYLAELHDEFERILTD